MNIERLEMLEKRLREMDVRLWDAYCPRGAYIKDVGRSGCLFTRMYELWPEMEQTYHGFFEITYNQFYDLFDLNCVKARAGRTQYDAADDIRKLINGTEIQETLT